MIYFSLKACRNIRAVLFGLLALGLLFFAATRFAYGTDVLRYTVPAGEESLYCYIQKVGLFRHILTMPDSAKRYLAGCGAEGLALLLLSGLCVFRVFGGGSRG